MTGPSGSGKSQSINALIDAFGNLECSPEPEPIKQPIIDAWPDSEPAKTCERLARVGLADAFSWARCPNELSAGQQARFFLALKLFHPAPLMVADEFCANLDRLTARTVAWAITREIRRTGKSAILVTSHDDLVADIQPDLHVKIGWTPQPELIWSSGRSDTCTASEQCYYERGTHREWQSLKHLHYQSGDPATVHSYHCMRHPDIGDPAAIAVLSYPDLHSAARNLATANAYKIGGSREAAQQLNRECLKLTRIVVAPQFRAAGIAKMLIQTMIQNTNARWYECVTAMGRFNRFLQSVGFQEIPQGSGPIESKVLDWAQREQIPTDVLLHYDNLPAWIDTLSVRKAREAKKLCWHYYHQFVLHRRHRNAPPKHIPGPQDKRWPQAFELVARRCQERPSYWIAGPIDR